MKFLLKKKIIILFVTIVFSAFFSKIVFAVWNGTFYNPGDTLNPECSPTDTDCDVLSPLTSTNISDTAYDEATWNGVTTIAPSKNAIRDKLELIIASSHNAVTLGTANGLSLSTQALSLALASTSTTGALSDTDWDTFNNKQETLISGTNIKTINSTSLLAAGDIALASALGADDNYVTDAQLVVIGNTSGTNTGDNAANSSTMYIGTTAVALNRASAALALTGITSIDGNAATVTGLSITAGQTLTVTTGGTLGSNAYTSTAYLPLAGGTLTGNLIFTDNQYDIGASGATRPRTGYFGTSVVAPSFVGNLTGNADTVTTNANLSGAITSVGNVTTMNSDLDSLTDVSVASPGTGNHLTWSGTTWIAAAPTSVVGSANSFFLDTTASLSDNYTLSTTPSSYSETANSKTVLTSTAPVFFERFVTGPLGRDNIPAGTWTFNTYGATDSDTGTNEIKFRINKRVAQAGMTGTFTGAGATRTFTVTGGTPFVPGDANASRLLASLIETPTQTGWISGYTSSSEVTVTLTDLDFVNVSDVELSAIYYYLFDTTTGDITGATPALYTTTTVQPAYTGLNDTDRLVIAYFGSSDSDAGTDTMRLYYGGAQNFSHFDTPISTLHNNLAGLNVGDYVHLTAAEYLGTGTGIIAKKDSPVFTTNVTIPLIIGGTAVGDKITYKSTTGAGTVTGIAHQFVGGTDGGTTAMTILNDGSVGVGIDAPTAQLHLVKADSSALSDLLINPTVKTSGNLIDAQVGGSSKFNVSNAGLATLSTGLVVPKIYPSADSTTAFQVNKADGTTNVLNVDTTNGRVGIGTASPSYNLDVSSAYSSVRVTSTTATMPAYSLWSSTTNGYLYVGVENNNGNGVIGDGLAYDGLMGTVGARGLKFATNSTTRMYIASAGNVGVGTTSPASKFHISGSPTASANYGTLSLGGGAFNGSTAGYFVGSASGTSLAVNEVSGYAGNLLDAQVAGVSKFKVDNIGTVRLSDTTAQLVLPISNDAVTPTLAFGDGDSGFYESADDSLGIAIAGGAKFTISASGIYANQNARSGMLTVIGGNYTVPTFTVFGDTDTGMGSGAADSVSLIAGAVEGLRITETTGANVLVISGTTTFGVGLDTSALVDILVNPTTKTSGNLIDLQVASASQFSVTNAGVVRQAGCTSAGGLSANVSGDIICDPSSEKFKESISDLDGSLSKILSLRPVSYLFKPEMNMGDKIHFGFISEEVAAVSPEFATYDKEGNPYGLDTNAILAETVKSIQEMNLNLDAISGINIPLPESPAESFLMAFFGKVSAWLADAGNGISNIFVKEVNTNTLCVSDESGDKTCLTKAQLDALLAGAVVSGGVVDGGGSSDGVVTSPVDSACVLPQTLIDGVCTDPVPEPSVEPATDPVLEPVIDPVPEPSVEPIDSSPTDDAPANPTPEPTPDLVPTQ